MSRNLLLNCFQDVSRLGVNLAKISIFGIGINITERLSSWKPKLLSFGGRLTLTKAVLGSLPLYYLSLFRAPKHVISMIERIRSRFFWGFKDDEKGIYWVKWSSVLANFDVGGLDSGSIYAKNMGLLAKWRCRFCNETGALWQHVICSLHGADGGFSSSSGNGLHCKKGVWEGITDIGLVIDNMGIPFRDTFIKKVVIVGWEMAMNGDACGIGAPPRSRTLSELQVLSALLSGLCLHKGTDGWRWLLDPVNSFLSKGIKQHNNSCFNHQESTMDAEFKDERKKKRKEAANLEQKEKKEEADMAAYYFYVIGGALLQFLPSRFHKIFQGVCMVILRSLWKRRNKVVHATSEAMDEELRIDIFSMAQANSLLWIATDPPRDWLIVTGKIGF
nr:RNA-directed DNA polymerase, eukaryota, reverse transcriptase zinc-binding domain protein [Tanacetum cinerariifolium]